MLPESTALTSGALAFAVECGLPPRMSYTVAGELAAKTPGGSLRGARIPVAAMDRWLES